MAHGAFGEVVAFRGFLHAPVSEAGVVCLFGALAGELGFMVERVGTGFPDCMAKRLVDPVRQVWERCRIEFEFKARNFLTHGHDPAGADLIVCWENDWLDAPVDVLELKAVIWRVRAETPEWVSRSPREVGLTRVVKRKRS